MSVRGIVRLGVLALASALVAVACSSQRVSVDDLPAECTVSGTLCAVGMSGVGDGGDVRNASFSNPEGWSRDAAGNLYIADTLGNRIRKVSANGTVTTLAGNGRARTPLRFGVRATETEVTRPASVAACPDGWVLFLDWYGTEQISGIDPQSGVLTLVAGIYGGGISVNDVPALSATFNFVGGSALACDDRNLLWIGDSANSVIRVLNRTDAPVTIAGRTIGPGRVVTVAGIDNFAGTGTDGTAWTRGLTDPQLALPLADGSFYVVEQGNDLLFYVHADGFRETVATGYAPWGIAVDAERHVFSTDGDNRVRVLNLASNAFTFAGVVVNPGERAVVANADGSRGFPFGDGGLASQQAFDWSEAGPLLDDDGNLLILDTYNGVLRRLDRDGALLSIFGGFAGAKDIADFLVKPSGIDVAPDGTLLATGNNAFLWQVNVSSGAREPIAGNGDPTRSGDGGLASSAGVYGGEIAVAPDGTIYIADRYNRVLRAIQPDGRITTIAGDGGYVDGGAGDGGPAGAAVFDTPLAVAVDSSGSLIFVRDDNEVRVVNRGSGTVTVAGVSVGPSAINRIAGQNAAGFGGDGGQAALAALNPGDSWGGLAVENGVLYIADTYNHRVRAVNLDTGVIRTVAGNGSTGFRGDGGLATQAAVGYPLDVHARGGYVWFTQMDGGAIRTMVAGTASIVTSVAGGTGTGLAGDGGRAIDAQLVVPQVLTVDGDGVVWTSDGSHRLWRIQP